MIDTIINYAEKIQKVLDSIHFGLIAEIFSLSINIEPKSAIKFVLNIARMDYFYQVFLQHGIISYFTQYITEGKSYDLLDQILAICSSFANNDPMIFIDALPRLIQFLEAKDQKNQIIYGTCRLLEEILPSFMEYSPEEEEFNDDGELIPPREPLLDKNSISENGNITLIGLVHDSLLLKIGVAIIDKLSQSGADSIMLIGDPDQAIFEWNTANPHLFMAKYNSPDWHSLDLSENRRSSEKICQLANRFSGNAMSSIAPDKDYAEKPCLKSYLETWESVNQITDDFIEKCKEIGLNELEYAVVFRGQRFGATYFGLANNDNSDVSSQSRPWKNGDYGVRVIVYGKYLIDLGKYTEGLSLIEKGYYKITKQVQYVSSSVIRREIAEVGFRRHREKMLDFISKLPSTNNILSNWIVELQQKGINLTVELGKAKVSIESLFRTSNRELRQERPYLRTIHSVKGMTLEAVLVFLSKKAGHTNYTTLLKKLGKNGIADNEELRIVYVACTRPKKLLWIAVPSDDIDIWKDKLSL